MAASVPKWVWFVAGGLGLAAVVGGSMTYGIVYAGGKALGRIKLEMQDGVLMSITVAARWRAMKAAAAKAGINLTVSSGFRTMTEQTRLWNLWLKKQALQLKVSAGVATKEDTIALAQLANVNIAASPGKSNHQNGRALDINVGKSFTSPTYLWLKNNAHVYGFTNDEGKSIGEPHHWVYGGELAA